MPGGGDKQATVQSLLAVKKVQMDKNKDKEKNKDKPVKQSDKEPPSKQLASELSFNDSGSDLVRYVKHST